MVTLDPLARLVLAAGCCAKTVPDPYCAGPDPCWTFTWNPAALRIVVAVCWESPTTGGTVTAPPDTVMVTVEPGRAVPVLGLWLRTRPAAWVEVGSGLTSTLKPAFCRVVSAPVSCWPTTFGTATGAAPLETYSVTTVLAGTLLPS